MFYSLIQPKNKILTILKTKGGCISRVHSYPRVSFLYNCSGFPLPNSLKSKQFSQNLALLYSFTFSCFGDKYLPNLSKKLLYRYIQTQSTGNVSNINSLTLIINPFLQHLLRYLIV